MTRATWLAAAAAVLVLAILSRAFAAEDALVVYCAHDVHLAEPVLEEFRRKTGIEVRAVYDTEATKTLGLVQRIAAERDRPQCDVLWCNEPLGALHLHGLGLLEPYRGPGFERIPAAWKDPEGHWVGFAARLRVWITGEELAHEDDAVLAARLSRALDGGDARAFALAVPLYGTTRFHVTALWAVHGRAAASAWLARLKDAGARFVRGNAAVKDTVVAGGAAFGFTDTDDAFLAADGGHRGGIVPVRVDGRALCMPNVAAIVRGTKRRAAAEALVDHLLSAETELLLARAGGQVPLGEVDGAALPARVVALRGELPGALPLEAVLPVHEDVLAWLAGEWSGQ